MVEEEEDDDDDERTGDPSSLTACCEKRGIDSRVTGTLSKTCPGDILSIDLIF